MASVIRNICYGQKYTSRGEERIKWHQCGILIEKDGKFYVKMQMIPVGIDPDGGIFFNVFDQNHGRDGGGGGGRNTRTVPDEPEDFDDDIPF